MALSAVGEQFDLRGLMGDDGADLPGVSLGEGQRADGAADRLRRSPACLTSFVDKLVGDPLCDLFGILGRQDQDDLREAGVDGDPRYDARRMVGLLIAGLRQPHPTSQ